MKRGLRIAMPLSLMVLLVSALFFSATGVALAQEEKPGERQEGQLDEEQGKEVPPELQEKIRELKESLRDLKQVLSPLMESVRDYVQKNRSTWREQQESWRQGIARRRELIQGLREQLAPLKLVIETTKTAREAIRADLKAAWDAWNAGDIQGAIEGIDQALAKIEEIKRVISEALQPE